MKRKGIANLERHDLIHLREIRIKLNDLLLGGKLSEPDHEKVKEIFDSTKKLKNFLSIINELKTFQNYLKIITPEELNDDLNDSSSDFEGFGHLYYFLEREGITLQELAEEIKDENFTHWVSFQNRIWSAAKLASPFLLQQKKSLGLREADHLRSL